MVILHRLLEQPEQLIKKVGKYVRRVSYNWGSVSLQLYHVLCNRVTNSVLCNRVTLICYWLQLPSDRCR